MKEIKKWEFEDEGMLRADRRKKTQMKMFAKPLLCNKCESTYLSIIYTRESADATQWIVLIVR